MEGLSRLIEHWAALGGTLQYNVDPQLSLYPVLRTAPREPWPLGIYPGGTGTIEVPFQYMKARPPFDDTTVRETMRTMLNTLDSVDIPAARLGLRPRFSLDVLGNPVAVEGLMGILTWFVATARDSEEANLQGTLA